MNKKTIKIKVGLFIIGITVLIIAALVYIASEKGMFSKMHHYHLAAKSGEGLSEGMPIVFSGFQIGELYDMELQDDGLVHIIIRIPEKHKKWIRVGSVFTHEKPVIGSPKIVVTTENMQAPLLPKDTTLNMAVVDDINQVIKKAQPVVEQLMQITSHVHNMTKQGGKIDNTLTNVEKITTEFAQKKSLLEMATGNKRSARALNKALVKMTDLTGNIENIIKNLDKVLKSTETSMIGKDGAVTHINTILIDVIKKLKTLDTLINNITKMSSDVSGTTTDIILIRKQLDETISNTNQMVKELQDFIPGQDEKEIKLP